MKDPFSNLLTWHNTHPVSRQDLQSWLAQIWLKKIHAATHTLTELNTFFPTKQTMPPDLCKLLAAVPAGPEGTPHAFTPEWIARLSEQQAELSRTNGIYYTPFSTGQLLAEHALDTFAQCYPGQEPLSVCDPAAGAGGLIIPCWLTLAQRIRARTGRALSGLLAELSDRFFIGDINPHALDALRLRAALTIWAHGGHIPPAFFTNRYDADALAGQTQSEWKTAFTHANEGFDLLLVNPPYIGQKNHKKLFQALRQNPRWAPWLSPKGDMLYLFFHLAFELLKPGGVAAFLTTTYFAQAEGAFTLRKRLHEQATLHKLIDFGETKLFKRAQGQHNLLTVFSTTHTETPCLVGSSLMSQADLFTEKALFLTTRTAPVALQRALTKMAQHPRLHTLARVSNGLMTGCDKISAAHVRQFPQLNLHKGDGVFVLSQHEKDALILTPAEQTKLKPFYKNSDITAYRAAAKPRYYLIDFFYPNDRETDFTHYPHLREHLARFAPVLLKRKQNNNGIQHQLAQGNYWFGSVRRTFDFETEKIVVAHRCRVNRFAFAPGPWYASSDVYFISHPVAGVSLWYLLALFNSAPYYAWLFYNGKRKGNMLELYAAPLQALPVPALPPRQQHPFEQLARQLYLAPSEHIQAVLDRRVADLFGFTEKEYNAIQACYPTR